MAGLHLLSRVLLLPSQLPALEDLVVAESGLAPRGPDLGTGLPSPLSEPDAQGEGEEEAPGPPPSRSGDQAAQGKAHRPFLWKPFEVRAFPAVVCIASPLLCCGAIMTVTVQARVPQSSTTLITLPVGN